MNQDKTLSKGHKKKIILREVTIKYFFAFENSSDGKRLKKNFTLLKLKKSTTINFKTFVAHEQDMKNPDFSTWVRIQRKRGRRAGDLRRDGFYP